VVCNVHIALHVCRFKSKVKKPLEKINVYIYSTKFIVPVAIPNKILNPTEKRAFICDVLSLHLNITHFKHDTH